MGWFRSWQERRARDRILQASARKTGKTFAVFDEAIRLLLVETR